MAASVEGVFVLIDRATGPMKRMEEQAKRTDRAISTLGDRMDNVGTSNQLKQYKEVGEKLRDVERQGQEAAGGMKSLDDNTKMLERTQNKAIVTGGRFGKTMLFMAGALAMLLPPIVDVAGALGALIGSLGAATLGVGALGTALGGSLLVGLAGVAGAGLAATKEMKSLKGELKDLKDAWEVKTRAGQDDFIGMLNDGLDLARKKLPLLATSANRSMKATRTAFADVFDRLDGKTFDRFIVSMTRTYEQIAGPLASALANVGETLANIAIAAAPFVDDLVNGIEKWTRGWVEATSNTGQMRKNMAGWIDQARSWKDLLGAAWDLTVSVFGSGKEEGQGLVDDMTRKLRMWNAWVLGNKDSMNSYWAESIEGTKQLAHLLGSLRFPLKNLNDAMEPIVYVFEKLTTALNELKIPGTEISGLTALVGGFIGTKAVGRVTGPLLGATRLTAMWVRMSDWGGLGGGGGMSSPPVAGGPAGGGPGWKGTLGRAAGAATRFLAPLAVMAGLGDIALDASNGNSGGALRRGGAMATGAAIGAAAGLAGGPLAPVTVPTGVLFGTAAAAVLPDSWMQSAGNFLGLGGGDGDAAAIPTAAEALGSLGAGRAMVRGNRRRSEAAASRVEAAERRLARIRERYGDNTQRALVAEANLAGARARSYQATKALDRSIVLRGTLRDASKEALRWGAVDSRHAVRDARSDLLEAATAVRARPGDRDALSAFTEAQKKFAQTTRALMDLVSSARRQISPGFARDLLKSPLSTLGMPLGQLPSVGRKNKPLPAWAGGRGLNPGQFEAPTVKGPGAGVFDIGLDAPKVKMPRIEVDDKVGGEIKGTMTQIAQSSSRINKQIKADTDAWWQANRKGMVAQMQRALPELQRAMGQIRSMTASELQKLGYSGSDAQAMMSAAGSGGGGGRQSGRSQRGATGMRIGGTGNQDSVRFGNNYAAPGELVVNRHTEAAVNRDLMHAGKAPLGARVNGENRPHYMAPPARERHFASGGRIIPAAGFPGESWNSAIAGPASKFISRYHLFLTDAFGSGHESPEHTQYGTAIDVVPGPGGSWDDVAQAAYAAVRMGWTPVGYDGTHGTEAWPGHGPPSMAGGNAHAHITVLSASEVAAGMRPGGMKGIGRTRAGKGQSIRVKAPRTRLKGMPGVFAQRGAQIYAAGVQKVVNGKLGGGAITAANLAGFGAINHIYKEHNSANGDWGGEKLPFNTIAALAEAAGKASGVDVPGVTMAQMTIGESNRRPGATGIDPGGTKGLGLWMITTGYNDELIARFGGEAQMRNPVKNALAMAQILKTSGQGAWYGDSSVTDRNAHFRGGRATGGRLDFGGWFGDGGRFHVERPTLIGVGERGGETVSVTPRGKSFKGAGGRAINVTIGDIHVDNKRPGDIKRIVKREITQAMDELADEMAAG